MSEFRLSRLAACLALAAALRGQPGPLQVWPRRDPAPADALGRASTLRVDANLVLIPVQVLDDHDRFVDGLGMNNFHVFEEAQERRVASISRGDQPVSVGIVLDTSGSMATTRYLTAPVLRSFFESANPSDEFLAVLVRGRPREASGFTRDLDKLVQALTAESIYGRTALYDSVYLAAQMMRQAANPRKVLLVITDADDNHSRYRARELQSYMREAGVIVYVLALPCGCDPGQGPSGEPVLWSIAEDTGGRYQKVSGEEDLPGALRNINIRDSYLVGFEPPAIQADGKYHEVKLRVSAPEEHKRLSVYWRRGYYAPAN